MKKQSNKVESASTDEHALLNEESVSFKRSGLLAYIILFFLGIGSLLPFYAFITAQNYYANKFCNTIFLDSFESFISIFYNLAQPIGLLITIKYNAALSIRSQVIYPLVVYAVLFSLTTIFVLINSMEGNILFAITLIFAFLCGMSGAIMNGGIFGLTGTLPSVNISAIVNGQAFAGLLIAIVNMITSASTASTVDCSDDLVSSTDDGSCDSSGVIDFGAFSFFLVSTIILVVCIASYLVLVKLQYIQHYDKIALQAGKMDSSVHLHEETETLLNPLLASPLPTAGGDEHNSSTAATTASERIASLSWVKIFAVLHAVRTPAYSVFITFTLTFSVYPSLIVLLQSQQNCHSGSSRLFTDLFVPFLFILFSGSDFLGRVIAENCKRLSPLTATNIHFPASLRVVLVVLIWFCDIQNSILPVLFPYDAVAVLLVVVMGLSHGFVVNSSMMLGPSLVAPKDMALAGTIMVFCLSFGLMCGSALSFVVLYIVTGSVI